MEILKGNGTFTDSNKIINIQEICKWFINDFFY